MTCYFGFEPTDKLADMIVEAEHIIDSGKDVSYYPLRNDIAQQISRQVYSNRLPSMNETAPTQTQKD